MQVLSTKQFRRDLVRLGTTDSKKVTKKIQQLPQFPKTPQLNIKKMKNKDDIFRLRVGDVRVLFSYDKKRQILILTQAQYRGSIYKD